MHVGIGNSLEFGGHAHGHERLKSVLCGMCVYMCALCTNICIHVKCVHSAKGNFVCVFQIGQKWDGPVGPVLPLLVEKHFFFRSFRCEPTKQIRDDEKKWREFRGTWKFNVEIMDVVPCTNDVFLTSSDTCSLTTFCLDDKRWEIDRSLFRINRGCVRRGALPE